MSYNAETAYRDGADATRLRANHAAHRAHAALDVVIQDELSHLGGFSAARFAAHHQHLVGVDQPDQLLMARDQIEKTGKYGYQRLSSGAMRYKSPNLIWGDSSCHWGDFSL